MISSVELEYINPSINSDKFWSGTVYENGTLIVQWGRNGTQGQSKTHICGSVPTAIEKLNKLVGEKRAKGYFAKSSTMQQNQQGQGLNPSTASANASKMSTSFKVVEEKTSEEVISDRSQYIKW